MKANHEWLGAQRGRKPNRKSTKANRRRHAYSSAAQGKHKIVSFRRDFSSKSGKEKAEKLIRLKATNQRATRRQADGRTRATELRQDTM